jgi:SAM-dependent methyltransferase
MANEEQLEYWNGEAGQRWADEDERMAQLLAPIAEALLDHVEPAPGISALDIGCGGGSQSLLLAERIGAGGSVLGVDISGPMLEVARQRKPGADCAALQFLQVDASSHAFEPASVDLLFSRFGVMFFDDPAAAFTNLHRSLKPGGRLGACCWQAARDNDWAWLPLQAALQHVPPPAATDPHAPGPFAFADAARVESVLADAGFIDIKVTPHPVQMRFGSGGDLRVTCEEVVGIGPVARLLMDQPAEVKGRVVETVAEVMAPLFSDGYLQLGGNVWFVTAFR